MPSVLTGPYMDQNETKQEMDKVIEAAEETKETLLDVLRSVEQSLDETHHHLEMAMHRAKESMTVINLMRAHLCRLKNKPVS